MSEYNDFTRDKNYLRRQRYRYDEVIINEILQEMKEKYEKEKQQKIEELQQQIEKYNT